MRFLVTHTVAVDADTPEAAAIEFVRLAQTTRPQDVSVTPAAAPAKYRSSADMARGARLYLDAIGSTGGKVTIGVYRVTRGEAKRIT